MNTLLDDEEKMVRDQARAFLADASPASLARSCEADRTYSTKLWSEIVRLGWLETSLSESAGGLGLPLRYTALLFEEAGRFIAPIPLVATMVPLLVLARHGGAGHAEVLKAVRAGDQRLSFAIQEETGAWSVEALRMTGRLDGNTLVLQGTKMFVDDFAHSNHCLVAFRQEGAAKGRSGLSLALVDTKAAGLTRTDLVSTAKDSHATLRFEGVRVPANAIVGELGNADALVAEAMDLASLFGAALLAGAARRATEFAVEYANQRVAFEQPVGSFQAIQHLCGDMLIGVDGAQLLYREAAWKMGEGKDASLEVSQAKAFANDKCVMACRSAQQIHGGIGFMMEYDLQLWYRRVVSWSLRYGTTPEHRRRVAANLLARKGEVRLDRELAL